MLMPTQYQVVELGRLNLSGDVSLDADSAPSCDPSRLRLPVATDDGGYALAITEGDSNGWSALATARPAGPQARDRRCREIVLDSAGRRTARDADGRDSDDCW